MAAVLDDDCLTPEQAETILRIKRAWAAGLRVDVTIVGLDVEARYQALCAEREPLVLAELEGRASPPERHRLVEIARELDELEAATARRAGGWPDDEVTPVLQPPPMRPRRG